LQGGLDECVCRPGGDIRLLAGCESAQVCRTINASHPMTIARADTRRSNPASSSLPRSGSIDGVADGGLAQQAQRRGCGSIVAPQPPAPRARQRVPHARPGP